MVQIAIVGDRNPENVTHRATERALNQLGADARWLPTVAIAADPSLLSSAGGLLIAPGSPYASMEGALMAIRHGREHGVPVLGTCGGFQHMVVEYARHVAGISGAGHAETDPEAHDLVVVPLACSLVGQEHPVQIEAGTRAAQLYGEDESVEPFFCSYGLSSAYRDRLEAAGLRFSGRDQAGEARILELPGHPFFIGTLFVPQAAVKRAEPHPLLAGLVSAARSPAGV